MLSSRLIKFDPGGPPGRKCVNGTRATRRWDATQSLHMPEPAQILQVNVNRSRINMQGVYHFIRGRRPFSQQPADCFAPGHRSFGCYLLQYIFLFDLESCACLPRWDRYSSRRNYKFVGVDAYSERSSLSWGLSSEGYNTSSYLAYTSRRHHQSLRAGEALDSSGRRGDCSSARQ